MNAAKQASRHERAAAMNLLVACVRGESLAPSSVERALEESSEPVFLRLADHHRVAGLAYEALRPLLTPEHPLVRALEPRYRAAADQHMRMIQAVHLAGRLLEDADCEWAIVKGPALVELLYEGAPGRRPYGDLDVLVHPADFRTAVERLTADGATLHDRNWKVLRRDMRGEVHVSLRNGVLIDLHWNLINMYRGRMAIDSAEVITRRRRVQIGPLVLPSLEPEDALLHLALHSALSGGDRLLWLADIERAITIWSPSWDRILERARRWRIGAPVGLMLARARDVLGAPVPDAVSGQLIGPGMRRLAGWVERVSPWQYGMGRLAAPTRLMARSVGKGPIGAPAWILWRVIRNMDPGQERRSLTFTPRGTERDREAFLDAVVEIGRASRG
jgi:hypothetical protein